MENSDFADTVETILHILRAEGFYAAEAALKREIDERCEQLDMQESENAKAAGEQVASSQDAPLQEPSKLESKPSGAAEQSSHNDGISKSPGQQAADSRRTKSGGPGRKPPKDAPRASASNQWEIYSSAPAAGHFSEWQNGDIDEYESDFDVGYIRQYIRGQAAFAESELDLRDDDCRTSGLKLYHQALQAAQSPQNVPPDLSHGTGGAGLHTGPRSEASHPNDLPRGSSQGAAHSSQPRGNTRPVSQVSSSSRGRSSTGKAASDIVVLGAVNATAPQNMLPLVVPPFIDLEEQPRQAVSPASLPQTPVRSRSSQSCKNDDSSCPPSLGPTSYALSHLSSEYNLESPLFHEPSLGRNIDLSSRSDLAVELDESSYPAEDQGNEMPPNQAPGGLWPMALIGSVGGAIGKVFGRRGSLSAIPDGADSTQLPPLKAASSGPLLEMGSPGVEASAESLRDLCLEVAPLQQQEVILEGIPSPCEDALLPSSKSRGFNQPDDPVSRSEEDAIDTTTNADDTQLHTPSLSVNAPSDAANADSAFSFAVNPASDTPVAAEPGRVFGTWASFGSAHSLPQKREFKGDNMSGKSSEYGFSGYSTDDMLQPGSDIEWSRPSSRNEQTSPNPKQMNPNPDSKPLKSVLSFSRPSSTGQGLSRASSSTRGPPLPSRTTKDSQAKDDELSHTTVEYEGQVSAQAGSDVRVPDTPPSQESKDGKAHTQPRFMHKPYTGPVQPLDTTISLPAKPGLEFLAHKQQGSHRSSRDFDSVPAYKPNEGPQSPWERDHGEDYQPPWEHDHGEAAHSPQVETNRTRETSGHTDESSEPPPDDYSSLVYQWDEDYLHREYEIFDVKIIHRRRKTGFEESKDIVINVNDLIAGRYQVTEFLGSAAFSQAVQAIDIKTNALVCLKIIKNNKDYLDQSLDEIKLLKYVNEHDPDDTSGILQLYDYFYYREHLFLVCELLRANLYEFQKFTLEKGQKPYFVLPRIQAIARQVLHSLSFMHSLGLIHCDLKPENILIKSFSRCLVKVIDLGSSCFTSDHLSTYVQSRSYRSPEVILGLPYDQKVDIWSLGCILAELLSGNVLLQTESMSTLLARMEGIIGPVPAWMLRKGRHAHRYYTISGLHYEHNEKTNRYEILKPKRSALRHRVPEADPGCLDFLDTLLTIDPFERPTAEQALQHPWLRHDYAFDFSS